MKARSIFAVSVVSILLAFSGQSMARTYKMIFWYPGEAGSTAEAEPVLEMFFEKLNSKSAPYKYEGKYFNTVADGIKYIKDEKPVVGIISFSALIQNGKEISNPKPVLATNPLPSGETAQKYSIAGSDSRYITSLISSEPLSLNFIRDNLFPGLSQNTKVESTDQLIFQLKRIAENSLKSCAILTPTESDTLKRISSPWAKNLKTFEESKPLPTARLVLFDPAWKGIRMLKDALISMNRDEEGREVLKELRLKGFTSLSD